MRKILLFTLLLTYSFVFQAQEDQMQFNMDLTFGNVNYTYDEIENSGYYFSNQAWYDTVHSLGFEHVQYTYKGLNLMVQAGGHFPVWNNGEFSFGVRPKAGVGRLIQVSPLSNQVVDKYGWPIENDPKRISSFSLSGEINGYFRYNMEPLLNAYSHLIILLGYRFMRSHDDYYTPTFGLEVGQEQWALGFYTHFNRYNYYREYSDGTREVAKSHHEYGFKINFFF